MQPITNCRVCDWDDLRFLFSLGDQYVSNFVDEANIQSGPKVPIELVRCESCGLVQQRYTAPQDFMYTRHYWYRSSQTESMKKSLEEIVNDCLWRMGDKIKKGDVVLDIGANDGELLKNYPQGYMRVGVEPAKNLAPLCQKVADLTIEDFWSYKSYEDGWKVWEDVKCVGRFTGSPAASAKIITAIGMFYDTDNPNSFIADVAKVLHPDGIFCAQLMCLKQTICMKDIGNFAHEHLLFYTLKSLMRLFGNHGLEIFDISENSTNGGSYRIFARHARGGEERKLASRKVFQFLEMESFLDDPQTYTSFFQGIERAKGKIREFIEAEVRRGKTVWAFGASTKGNVLLQYWDLNYPLITAAVDKSPEKWGKYTVGTGITIKNEQEFRGAKPDYALCLPYSFIREFVEREKAWLNNGGQFIVPLPEPRLVSREMLQTETQMGHKAEIPGLITEDPL